MEPACEGLDATTCAIALAGRPGLAWLDGDGGHGETGGYSFVGSDPVEVRRARAGDPSLPDLLEDVGRITCHRSPDGGSPVPEGRVPRWIGYVAYDAAHRLGEAARGASRHARGDSPGMWLGRYDALLAIDHAVGRTWLVGDDAAACRRLRDRIAAGVVVTPAGSITSPPVVGTRTEHEAAVRSALEHISAGDIYQVNLARRWSAGYAGDPLALWLAMRRASPVPLGMYVDAGDHAVLARTMETFLAWDGPGGRLETRPIKGTIARSGIDDEGEARALRGDEKEQAEHAMIVDLMRNDLGRVAATGTVRVEEHMAVEPYAKLSHLVSTVACRTRPGVGLAEVMRATFPPGSVTGAPKLRAMEIIDALEPHPRGVYCGCVGAVTRTGGARWAVAIRTAQVRDGTVCYHAGGGLVSASVPSREVAETELKARVFLDAIAELEARPEACTIAGSRGMQPEHSGVV